MAVKRECEDRWVARDLIVKNNEFEQVKEFGVIMKKK